MATITQQQFDDWVGGQDKKSNNRKAGGARAKKSGDAFENAIDAIHRQYFVRRIADFERFAMPTRPVSHGRLQKMIGHPIKARFPMLRQVEGKAPIDFSGVLGPKSPFPSRAIMLEAKRNTDAKNTLPIVLSKREGGKGGSGLGEHQLARLVRMMDFGGVGVVLWRNGPLVGVLGCDGVRDAYIRRQRDGVKRIDRSHFVWLEEMSFDYLPVVFTQLSQNHK